MPGRPLLPAAVRRWLLRPHTPEPSPIVLDRRRIFIIPSGQGLVFAVVLVIMYLGAVNYALGLGHLLVFLLASLGMTGMFHGFRNLNGLQILAGRAEPVFAGETAVFEVVLRNPGDLPRQALILQAPGAPPAAARLAAGEQRSVRIALAAPRRGWLRPGRLTLLSAYPLGLFRAWSHPHPDLRCLIYPAPLAKPLPPMNASAADVQGRQAAGTDDFAGLRPHSPSDPLRHVAWKSYARDPDNRPLLVKHFAGGATPELRLDWHSLPTGCQDEERLSILAGWVLAASELGLRYTLRLPSGDHGPDTGDRHANRCLQALALFGIDDDGGTAH